MTTRDRYKFRIPCVFGIHESLRMYFPDDKKQLSSNCLVALDLAMRLEDAPDHLSLTSTADIVAGKQRQFSKYELEVLRAQFLKREAELKESAK